MSDTDKPDDDTLDASDLVAPFAGAASSKIKVSIQEIW